VLLKAVRVAGTGGGILSVKPLMKPKTGIVITGNEVFSGLIQDKFAPLLKKKLHFFECEVMEPVYSPDDQNVMVQCIRKLIHEGAQLLMVAGGMSVDPDDISRMAIIKAGAEDVVYGTPVLPGAMFLYGIIEGVPILGLPACILYHKTTILDLLLPRVLAGERITRRDLAAMAHGGLCLNCEVCRYPVCPFGK
jgi:molybdopterin biosynthesis enzyme